MTLGNTKSCITQSVSQILWYNLMWLKLKVATQTLSIWHLVISHEIVHNVIFKIWPEQLHIVIFQYKTMIIFEFLKWSSTGNMHSFNEGQIFNFFFFGFYHSAEEYLLTCCSTKHGTKVQPNIERNNLTGGDGLSIIYHVTTSLSHNYHIVIPLWMLTVFPLSLQPN